MPACPFNVTPAPLAGRPAGSYLYLTLQGGLLLFDSFYYSLGPHSEVNMFTGPGDRDFHPLAKKTRGCASPGLPAGPSPLLCLTRPLPQQSWVPASRGASGAPPRAPTVTAPSVMTQ